MKPKEPEELITKFLETDDYEFTSEETYKVVCECLERLHSYYGFDDWQFAGNWVFESLQPDWDEVDSSKDNIEKLISSVDGYFFDMSKSVEFDLCMGNSLTKYKNKPLYTRNGRLLTKVNEEIYPLLLAIKVLLPVYFDKKPDANTIVLATKLIGCADKIRMMTSLNLLWLSERNRNINKNLNKRLTNFDKKAINVKRRELLGNLVLNELFTNENLTANEIYDITHDDYENLLIEKQSVGEISNADLLGDGKDSEHLDVTNVTDEVMIRWIEFYIEEFNNLPD